MGRFSYLILIILTLSYPLLKSFDPKIQYYKTWKYLLPSILIAALAFGIGDIWFVYRGVWSFNSNFVLGFYIFNLPFEECLFFVIIPFSSIFIYEVMNYFIKRDILVKQSKYISVILIIFLFSTASIFHDRFYTLIIFVLLSIFLFIHQFILKSGYLSRFYLLWTVLIIPFLIFDGVVTYIPIVIYNNAQTLGVRIISIPIEDLFYGILQILLVITLYEWYKKWQASCNHKKEERTI